MLKSSRSRIARTKVTLSLSEQDLEELDRLVAWSREQLIKDGRDWLAHRVTRSSAFRDALLAAADPLLAAAWAGTGDRPGQHRPRPPAGPAPRRRGASPTRSRPTRSNGRKD